MARCPSSPGRELGFLYASKKGEDMSKIRYKLIDNKEFAAEAQQMRRDSIAGKCKQLGNQEFFQLIVNQFLDTLKPDDVIAADLQPLRIQILYIDHRAKAVPDLATATKLKEEKKPKKVEEEKQAEEAPPEAGEVTKPESGESSKKGKKKGDKVQVQGQG